METLKSFTYRSFDGVDFVSMSNCLHHEREIMAQREEQLKKANILILDEVGRRMGVTLPYGFCDAERSSIWVYYQTRDDLQALLQYIMAKQGTNNHHIGKITLVDARTPGEISTYDCESFGYNEFVDGLAKTWIKLRLNNHDDLVIVSSEDAIKALFEQLHAIQNKEFPDHK